MARAGVDAVTELASRRLSPANVMQPDAGYVALQGGEAFFVVPYAGETASKAIYRVNGEIGELPGAVSPASSLTAGGS